LKKAAKSGEKRRRKKVTPVHISAAQEKLERTKIQKEGCHATRGGSRKSIGCSHRGQGSNKDSCNKWPMLEHREPHPPKKLLYIRERQPNECWQEEVRNIQKRESLCATGGEPRMIFQSWQKEKEVGVSSRTQHGIIGPEKGRLALSLPD